MPIRVRLTSRGLIQEQVTSETPMEGVSPGKLNSTALTASTTLTQPGFYTVSGGSALTITLPAATTVPGAQWIFRSLSAHAHVLSGAAGGSVRYTNGTSDGGMITFPATVGSSVVMQSDGLTYIVLGNSGSMTYTD